MIYFNRSSNFSVQNHPGNIKEIILKIKTSTDYSRSFPFDEKSVAVGNLKDPDKILEKIQAAKLKSLNDGALEAVTGRVIAISLGVVSWGDNDFSWCSWNLTMEDNMSEQEKDSQESLLLKSFYQTCAELSPSVIQATTPVYLITWGGSYFDIPYLLQRSAILGVQEVYTQQVIPTMESIYLHNRLRTTNIEANIQIVDLSEMWHCNRYSSGKRTSLRQLAFSLNLLQGTLCLSTEASKYATMPLNKNLENVIASGNVTPEEFVEFKKKYQEGIDQADLSNDILKGVHVLYPVFETFLIFAISERI